MQHRSAVFVALLLGAVASPLAGQESVSYTTLQKITWDPGSDFVRGVVTRMVGADFNGDLHPDIAALDDGRVVLAYGPANYRVTVSMNVAGNDIDVLPGGSDAGYPGIVGVNDDGLFRTWIDYTQPPDQFVQHEFSSPPGWGNATGVRSAVISTDPVTGEDEVGLVGLNRTRDKLLFIEDANDERRLLPAVLTHGTAFDFFPLDWDGDGLSEVGVVTTSGAWVYETDGTLAGSFPLPVQQGLGTGFRQDGYSKDRMAFAAEVTGYPGSYLFVFDDDLIEVAEGLSSSFPASISAARVSGPDDIDDDLVFTSSDETQTLGPVVLFNRSNGVAPALGFKTFSVTGADSLEPDLPIELPPDPGQSAQPVLMDVTGDGDVDLCYYSQKEGKLLVAESTTVIHRSFLVALDFEESEATWDQPDGIARLQARLHKPAATIPGANGLLIEQWVQGDPGGTEQLGAHAWLFPLNNLLMGSYQDYYLRLWDNGVSTEHISHVSIRAVEVEGATLGASGELEGGTLVASGPAITYALAMYGDAEDWIQVFLLTLTHYGNFNYLYIPTSYGDIGAPGLTFFSIPQAAGGLTEEGSSGTELPPPPPNQDPPQTPRPAYPEVDP